MQVWRPAARLRASRIDEVLFHRCNFPPSSSGSSTGSSVDFVRDSFRRMRSKTGMVLVVVVPDDWRPEGGVRQRRSLIHDDTPSIEMKQDAVLNETSSQVRTAKQKRKPSLC